MRMRRLRLFFIAFRIGVGHLHLVPFKACRHGKDVLPIYLKQGGIQVVGAA